MKDTFYFWLFDGSFFALNSYLLDFDFFLYIRILRVFNLVDRYNDLGLVRAVSKKLLCDGGRRDGRSFFDQLCYERPSID